MGGGEREKKPDDAVAPAKADPVLKHWEGNKAGVEALMKLLAQGRPSAEDVVAIFDHYPNEHNALLKLVQSHLGNGFVNDIVPRLKLTKQFQTPTEWGS